MVCIDGCRPIIIKWTFSRKNQGRRKNVNTEGRRQKDGARIVITTTITTKMVTQTTTTTILTITQIPTTIINIIPTISTTTVTRATE